MEKTEYIKSIECAKCRYRNEVGTKFCADCGADLTEEILIVCGNCGSENKAKSKFCGNCGNNLENPKDNDPDIRHLQEALKGKYVVQKPLGEGGFGRVFLAEHTGLGQMHVIKLLSADSSRSTEVRNRFFQEAKVLAKLKHPNIVPIMDVSEFGGRPYYVMSYLNGGSLADLLRKEKNLSVEKALEYVQKLLSALSEVHEKGIIHRDIKPENVLLDEKGEPVLIDFGIARVEESSKARTATGFSIGTPQYMSPEQLDGKPITLTTDIYSMGIMLFELITGKPPYEGSFISIANQHNSGNLPSIRGKFRESHLEEGVQGILQKACAKEASARYSSAKEMREAMEELLRNKVEVPREKSQSETEKKNVPHNDKIETKKIDESDQKVKKRWFQNRKIFVGVLGLVLVVLFYFTKDFILNEEDIIVSIPSGKTFTNSIGMEFIEIPAGKFMMGCSKGDKDCKDDEKPRHKVRLSHSFFMGKYEVTQGQWMAVMGENPSYFENCGKICPVEFISYYDVQTFIQKLCLKERKFPCNYQLPTEAEWEYAARAGVSSVYYWGELKNNNHSWHKGNSIRNSTNPVGLRKPNNWGLYDMSGNVWEMVEDDLDKGFYKNSPSIDPLNLTENKEPTNNWSVMRGGSFKENLEEHRSSKREGFFRNDKGYQLGFRLVYKP